jgi:hypothetical protein
MYPGNLSEVFRHIRETDLVVDIGGGAQPLRRADKIVDVIPYDKRGSFGSIGSMLERFRKEDWIVRDLCLREPLPFRDKEVDFVFCSHVLEDVRDPVWLCSEIVRIGKRGYIETPSRLAESCRGMENFRYPGFMHHRWLIEYASGKSEIVFFHKSQLLNTDRNFVNILAGSSVLSFFWEGSFGFREEILADQKAIRENLKSFVEEQRKNMSRSQVFLNSVLYYAPAFLGLGIRINEFRIRHLKGNNGD